MVRTGELDYDLPERLIAVRPAEPRDACRVMVVSRSDPSRIEHRVFRDLPSLVRAGDLLVMNSSRVVPARIAGKRADTGAKVEGLFLAESEPGAWVVLLKANTRLRPGIRVTLHSREGAASPWSLELIARQGEGWRVGVVGEAAAAREILARVGATPLPPYILAARRHAGVPESDDLDREWYQTVYAERDRAGSVAAPTAGLHFTPELLATLEAMGVGRTCVTLDVGMGTFKPIEVERVEEHPIHAEEIEVSADALRAMSSARAAGGRVIAVGTTSVRAIESVPGEGAPEGVRGATSIFILPGHRFRWTDAMITNFHLPRSTLMGMVGAFIDGGIPRLVELYREAIAREYRFYSYGDAMLILP